MMKAVFVSLLATATIAVAQVGSEVLIRPHSIVGPFPNPEEQKVAFWDISGAALLDENGIHITPNVQRRSGAIWNKYPIKLNRFMIEVEIRITGGKAGADGMALWVTKERNSLGSVFGGVNKWNGLGIIFDSFNNDRRGSDSHVMAVLNDGSFSFKHLTDHDGGKGALGKCDMQLRNTMNPIRARVTFDNKKIEVALDLDHIGEYTACFLSQEIDFDLLSDDYYIGMSAATGGFSDDHSLFSLKTYALQGDKEDVGDDSLSNEDMELDRKEQEFHETHKESDNTMNDGLTGLQHSTLNEIMLQNSKLAQYMSMMIERMRVIELNSNNNVGDRAGWLNDFSKSLQELSRDLATLREIFLAEQRKIFGPVAMMSRETKSIIATVNDVKRILNEDKRPQNGGGESSTIFTLGMFILGYVVIFVLQLIASKMKTNNNMKKFH